MASGARREDRPSRQPAAGEKGHPFAPVGCRKRALAEIRQKCNSASPAARQSELLLSNNRHSRLRCVTGEFAAADFGRSLSVCRRLVASFLVVAGSGSASDDDEETKLARRPLKSVSHRRLCHNRLGQSVYLRAFQPRQHSHIPPMGCLATSGRSQPPISNARAHWRRRAESADDDDDDEGKDAARCRGKCQRHQSEHARWW